MSLQSRAQALLDLVEGDRERQCRALVGNARAQAATLLAQARSAARARARQAFAAERQRAAAALAAAEADLATRRRLHAQRRMEALLARARRRLPELLRQRWAAADTRALWVALAVRDAERQFAGGTGTAGGAAAPAWTLHHAEPWPEAERAALAARLGAPRLVADARIGAGLRIVAGSNVVDATLEGLLADRDEIGGRIVGLLEGTVR
jgi:hypothetical protein